MFDYGPDKLAHVKSSLLAFCNKHLNKINLEVTDLENQFKDGVYLVLLMGLLEGYFVPLYSFDLQVSQTFLFKVIVLLMVGEFIAWFFWPLSFTLKNKNDLLLSCQYVSTTS